MINNTPVFYKNIINQILSTSDETLIYRKLKENKSMFTQSSEDVEDAKFTLNGFLMNSNFISDYDIACKIDIFLSPHETQKIPISEITIHHDWKRRISGENLEIPVIVMKHPESGYIILDGQHRVLSKKEMGLEYIEASVLELPWKRGIKTRYGRRFYY